MLSVEMIERYILRVVSTSLCRLAARIRLEPITISALTTFWRNRDVKLQTFEMRYVSVLNENAIFLVGSVIHLVTFSTLRAMYCICQLIRFLRKPEQQ